MRRWALVPVKRFEQGKSRLDVVLDGAARAELARAMFDHVVGEVLGALAAAGEIEGALVVTDSEEVAARARLRGAEASISPAVAPGRQLGAIVDEALASLAARGAEAVMVLMGDLPALSADDVRALAALLDAHDLVLAPDAAGTGTNALALRLPAPMPTCFRGGESLADHVAAARARGLSFALCERAGLGFDVDQPEDYLRLRAAG